MYPSTFNFCSAHTVLIFLSAVNDHGYSMYLNSSVSDRGYSMYLNSSVSDRGYRTDLVFTINDHGYRFLFLSLYLVILSVGGNGNCSLFVGSVHCRSD